MLSQTLGQVKHVLLTRLPLPDIVGAFDLHVLSLLLTFILSQGQTLHNKPFALYMY